MGIQTTFDLKFGVDTDIPFKYLTIVADKLDNVVGKLFIKPQSFAVSRGDPQKTLDIWILALQHLINILGGDAQVFSGDHSQNTEINDVTPLFIPMAHRWSQGLFGDDIRQDLIIDRIRSNCPDTSQLRGI